MPIMAPVINCITIGNSLNLTFNMQSSILIPFTFCHIQKISPHGLLAEKNNNDSFSGRARQHYFSPSATEGVYQPITGQGKGEEPVGFIVVSVVALAMRVYVFGRRSFRWGPEGRCVFVCLLNLNIFLYNSFQVTH